MIFRQVRELFIFTNRERSGLLVLSFLLIASVCINFLLPRLIPEKDCDVTVWEVKADSQVTVSGSRKVTVAASVLPDFNPNSVVRGDLDKMGIPERLAGGWINYLAKGGRFRTREELKKLYGMTDLIYARLESHVKIPPSEVARKMRGEKSSRDRNGFKGASQADSLKHHFRKEKKGMGQVEINLADSAMLEALPGIGPVLAARIIRYRMLLGGFHETGQLKDVYGMTEELWLKAAPYLVADTVGLKKLEINFLALQEMGRHPYIGYKTAKRLVRQRDINGKFENGQELTAFFSPDSLRRLLPYLRFGVGSF